MVNPFRKVCAACAHWKKAPQAEEVLCDTLGACAMRPPIQTPEEPPPADLTEACHCCEAYAPRV